MRLQGSKSGLAENLLKGPLPDTDDLDIFRNARAEYLSHFDELAVNRSPMKQFSVTIGVEKTDRTQYIISVQE